MGLDSKLIAVNGPPGCGKTTLTLKLAQAVHEKTKKKVVYVSSDTLIPAMGLIFPKREKGSLLSLGKALENVNLAITDLLGVILTTQSMKNMGYLGYVPGEGPYSYPAVDESKIHLMLQLLKEHFDYIFVDCNRDREDITSTVACGLSDHLIQMVNPDIKSIAYYGFEAISDKAIQVMNLLDNNIYLPIQETKAHFPNLQYTILYSKAAKMQMCEGTLMDLLQDPVYAKGIKPIVDIILAEIEVPAEFEGAEEHDAGETDPLSIAQSEEFWQ